MFTSELHIRGQSPFRGNRHLGHSAAESSATMKRSSVDESAASIRWMLMSPGLFLYSLADSVSVVNRLVVG